MSNVNYSGKYSHVVKGVFSSSDKKYQYKTTITDLKKNDKVVVESSTGLGILTIKEVLEDTFANADKNLNPNAWVIQRVDMAEQNKRKETHKQRSFILRKMKEQQEQLQELQMFALMAKDSPEMAKMLEEFTELGA